MTKEQIKVTKSLDEELMQALYIVMVPGEVDLHGDITSEEDVRKACFNFNKFCRTPNLFHLEGTDLFEFADSYLSPVEFELDGKLIKKGTWLATVQYKDNELWELAKSGKVNGLSIGALAHVEDLEE